ncbi:MAG: hypothetical protein E2O67_00725 [Deltaproteobacteria bacterium]|nr:MAG: hypothetical protein E2O67_00725 [Deltaproteobacteria bacterium]
MNLIIGLLLITSNFNLLQLRPTTNTTCLTSQENLISNSDLVASGTIEEFYDKKLYSVNFDYNLIVFKVNEVLKSTINDKDDLRISIKTLDLLNESTLIESHNNKKEIVIYLKKSYGVVSWEEWTQSDILFSVQQYSEELVNTIKDFNPESCSTHSLQ